MDEEEETEKDAARQWSDKVFNPKESRVSLLPPSQWGRGNQTRVGAVDRLQLGLSSVFVSSNSVEKRGERLWQDEDAFQVREVKCMGAEQPGSR